MKIRIIQIGKTKDKYLLTGIEEFLTRLKPFAAAEITTLKEISPGKTFSKERAKEEEGKEILKAIRENEYVIVLDEKGREYNSVDFAKVLGKLKDRGASVAFVVGGAYGLSEEVRARADATIALSQMTFTHQMVRLVLLEQLYRGFCILNGKEYHN